MSSRSCSSLSRFLRSFSSSRKPAAYAQDLIRSLALDPAHRDILANLEVLFTTMQSLPEEKRQMPTVEIKSKLEAFQRVRASLAASK